MVYQVVKSRASGAPGVRFPVSVVAEDNQGLWLMIEPMAPHVHDDGWVVAVLPNPVLALIPREGIWVAATSYAGAKVDLCSRIVIRDDCIEFEDVELDVVWHWGEPARLEDVDEFEALVLPGVEVERYMAEADRIRRDADAGIAPFGADFRQRLVDKTDLPDPSLLRTWAAGVGPIMIPGVVGLLGRESAEEWLARQRTGAGWMLCGGSDVISAVVWLDATGDFWTVGAAATPEGSATSAFLLRAAPGLVGFAAPPCWLTATPGTA